MALSVPLVVVLLPLHSSPATVTHKRKMRYDKPLGYDAVVPFYNSSFRALRGLWFHTSNLRALMKYIIEVV